MQNYIHRIGRGWVKMTHVPTRVQMRFFREFFLRAPFILEFSLHTPFYEPLFLGALGWIREEVKRASAKSS